MVLPQGFKRNSTKIAEEIDIPCSKPAPANIGGQLVPIASLDKVGQHYEDMHETNFCFVYTCMCIQQLYYYYLFNTTLIVEIFSSNTM